MPKTQSELDSGPPQRTSTPHAPLLSEKVTVTKPAVAGNAAIAKDARADLSGDGTYTRDVTADPRKEYVAAGGYQWLTHYLRSLPLPIDDVTRDFGPDLYERMLLDAQVSSKFDTFKLGVLSHDIDFLPVEDAKKGNGPTGPFGKAPRQSSDRAKEIADFCNRAKDRLARSGRSLEETCMELLDGAAFGNKVAEVIYEVPAGGPDAGMLTLRALKAKPRGSTAFVVDAYFNVVGLLGLIPGQGYPVIVEGIMGTPDQVPNLLPREKFAVLTWKSRDGDPRGSSVLRPAYDPWWLKTQTKGEHLKYLTRFASPSLVGETAPGAMSQPQLDPSGNPVVDAFGNPIILQPEQAMNAALQGFINGTVITVPNGAKVMPLQVAGNGEAFLKALDWYDQQIAKSILLQTLATDEGEHQARASSETQQDVMSLLFRYGRKVLAWTLWRDILQTLVRYNFGEEALPLTPVVSLGENEHYDFASNVTALGAVGYTLDPSQFDSLDADQGLPARATNWQQAAQDRQDAVAAGKVAGTADPKGSGAKGADPADTKGDDDAAE